MLYRFAINNNNEVIHQYKEKWWHLQWKDITTRRVKPFDGNFETSLSPLEQDFVQTHAHTLSKKHPQYLVQILCGYICKLMKNEPFTKLIHLDKGNNTYPRHDLYSYLKSVVYLVECDNDNRRQLYVSSSKHCSISSGYRFPENKIDWVESRSGYQVTIGRIGPHNVNLSITIDKINGYDVLFYEPVSTWVSWDLIDEWLKFYFPDIQKTNAGNFFNVVHHTSRLAQDNENI